MNSSEVDKTRIAMVAITLHGTSIVKKLAGYYPDADVFLSEKFIAYKDTFPETANSPRAITTPVKLLMGQLFEEYDYLVLVFSIGAAVRLMAPFLKSKREDPGVVVIDDCGQFVVPVLSGHIGGANAFATDVAQYLNATPVYTTASEARQTLPVDILGRELGWTVEAPHANQVKVAAHVVNDEPVAFIQEAGSTDWWPYKKKLPENIHLYKHFYEVKLENYAAVLWVTHAPVSKELWNTLEGRLIVYRPPVNQH